MKNPVSVAITLNLEPKGLRSFTSTYRLRRWFLNAPEIVTSINFFRGNANYFGTEFGGRLQIVMKGCHLLLGPMKLFQYSFL